MTLTQKNNNRQKMIEAAGEKIWKQMKYGLFMHHVFGGNVDFLTPLSKNGERPENIDEFVERFDIKKWQKDVLDMGVEYCIITAWHCETNPIYPSDVTNQYRGAGHCPTKRDLLGEMIDALLEIGVAPLCYVNIWDGFDYHPLPGGKYPDIPEDKIRKDILTTGFYHAARGKTKEDRAVWQGFIESLTCELVERYKGKLKGLWFDGTWTSVTDVISLMNAIKRVDPHMAIIGNGDESQVTPYASKETASPTSDDYGFGYDSYTVKQDDVTTWPVFKRSLAFIQGGNWWAVKGGKANFDAKTIFIYTVAEACANTNGGGVSWSMSVYANSDWEEGTLEALVGANELLAPIAESVKNTLPSTSYVTRQLDTLASLRHGICATRSVDDKYEYIHVINPPKDSKTLYLPLPADGKRFSNAVLLHNKESVSLVTTDTGLEITINEDWNELDTVIRLTSDEAFPILLPEAKYNWDFADRYRSIWSIANKDKMCDTQIRQLGDNYALEYEFKPGENIQLNGELALDLIDIRKFKTVSFKLFTSADSNINSVMTNTILGAPGLLMWHIPEKFDDRKFEISNECLTADGKYRVTEISLNNISPIEAKIARIYVHLNFDGNTAEKFYIGDIRLH